MVLFMRPQRRRTPPWLFAPDFSQGLATAQENPGRRIAASDLVETLRFWQEAGVSASGPGWIHCKGEGDCGGQQPKYRRRGEKAV